MPAKVVYYTSGVSGLGRLVRGIAIGLGLRRQGVECEFVVASSSPHGDLVRRFGFEHTYVHQEPGTLHTRERYRESVLYPLLCRSDVRVLLVDMLWFPLRHMIEEIDCPKIFLCRQVDDRFWAIPAPEGTVRFDPSRHDRLFFIEPFASKLVGEPLNPIVIRHRSELMARGQARRALGIDRKKRICLVSCSGAATTRNRLLEAAIAWCGKTHRIELVRRTSRPRGATSTLSAPAGAVRTTTKSTSSSSREASGLPRR